MMNTNDFTVSVAMATYNGERFLQEQLDSLARQTLLPCELVVCDDGSTDGTLDILNSFAAKAPFPVSIYPNETRLGYGLNFLRAASLCSGDLIAFCDQDDVWLEQKLARCSAVISSTKCNLVIHSARVVDGNLKPLGPQTPSARRLTLLDSCILGGWRTFGYRLEMCLGFSCVFLSRLLKNLPPEPPLAGPGFGHERWLFFAAEVTGSIALVPDALVLYRQHNSNVVGFRRRRDLGDSLVLRVGYAQYWGQAEDAEERARLLAEAAVREPELLPRLVRAHRFYKARAGHLHRRASLYGDASSKTGTARRLWSLILGGAYVPSSRGGLGLRALAKDLVVPLLHGERMTDGDCRKETI